MPSTRSIVLKRGYETGEGWCPKEWCVTKKEFSRMLKKYLLNSNFDEISFHDLDLKFFAFPELLYAV
jgi:hypothetical protein